MSTTIMKFIKYYIKKDTNNIDKMMELFSSRPDIQMIGIGATKPGEYKWFIGKDEIRDIILSDWEHWGEVHFDFNSLRYTDNETSAWFSVCAKLKQIEPSETSLHFFSNKMKELLESDEHPHHKMFEATHYGMRRIRELKLGPGYEWPMVITGTLIKEDELKIHTLHWSMPVD